MKLREDEDKEIKRTEFLKELARNLNIPWKFSRSYQYQFGGDIVVSLSDLWDILSDEGRLKDLISRVRNKAFW